LFLLDGGEGGGVGCVRWREQEAMRSEREKNSPIAQGGGGWGWGTWGVFWRLFVALRTNDSTNATAIRATKTLHSSSITIGCKDEPRHTHTPLPLEGS
jgi:hypothetical protein